MALAKDPIMFCMVATPFTDEGKLDEKALRAHLHRMIEAKNGVYLGSGGAGEGHALIPEELKRVYEIGVEECKGKVPTYANPRESRTANDMLSVVKLAVATNVDVVQLYPMDGGHGMRPTPAEQERYYRDLLEEIKHPVAISVNVAVGYTTPIDVLQKLCGDYRQIVAVNIMGPPMGYFVQLKDAIRADIALYTGAANILESLPLGSNGCLEAESNICPRLCQSIVDYYVAGDMTAAGEAMANFHRFANIVNRWAPATARWVKMAMKVLNLPGGNGVLRRPYLLPSEADQKEMARQFDKMGLKKLEGLA